MANSSTTFHILILISLLIPNLSQSKPTPNGFTTDLIHRDSPQSPSYDPSLSHSQSLVNAIHRSSHRLQRFRRSSSPSPDLINANGEYLMRYSVGTPPIPSIGVADTGSDIVWTQCQPCLDCFKQSLPIFDPRTSSTYKTIACNTPACESVHGPACNVSNGKNCLYSETYGGGSFTMGNLSTDTITLAISDPKSKRRVVSIPKVMFGCGFMNGGKYSGAESGIVGLGGGKASLVGQLGSLADGKFSYCMAPFLGKKSNSSSGKLSFGDNAVVLGKGVGSTPVFLRKEIDYTFYYATLLGISVGNRKVEMPSNSTNTDSPREQGNIIVDSGTTLTILPDEFYDKLKSAVESAIGLKRVKDPTGVLDLCFHAPSTAAPIEADFTVHFKGADLKWKQENAFVRVNDGVLCLAAQPARDADVAIYGNLAQTNFLVGYDLRKRTLSFKPADCAKL